MDENRQPIYVQDEGSTGLGIVLGIFLTWIGIIIAYIIGKKNTIKGSWIGLLIRVGIYFAALLFYLIFYLGIFGVMIGAMSQ